MAQIFPKKANDLVKVIIVSVVLGGTALATVAVGIWRSPFVTQKDVAKQQVVPFSHLHHVKGLGIDCRYCHTTVETSSFAGIPPTETCMSCHSQIWTNAKMLEPVRTSYKTQKPLEWIRVNDVPDFVYFNHSIHINKGVGCVTCHGQVDEMPLMHKGQTLRMGWCLQCHRNPEKFVRPPDQVFNMQWQPPADQLAEGLELVKNNHVKVEQLTNCSVCHR